MRRARILLLLAAGLLAAALAVPLFAQDFSFAVDVPVILGGTPFNTSQLLHQSGGTYGLGVTIPGLPSGAKIDALDMDADGFVYFSTEAPFTVGSQNFHPGDIVLYKPSSGTFGLILSSVTDLGLSPSCNIDALSLLGNTYVVSFDAPETLTSGMAMVTFMPNELVQLTPVTPSGYNASLFGNAPGGAGVNLRGVEAYAYYAIYFGVDAPVNLPGPVTAVPGDILRWDGSVFSVFYHHAGLPSNALVTDFVFDSPGRIRTSADTPPENGLRVTKTLLGSPGQIDLTWTASCLPAGDDYAVYEGTIGSWYSHYSVLCSTSGATNATISPSPNARYYLVVPRNEVLEGSYGMDSAGYERPAGSSPCVPYRKVWKCAP